MTNEEAIKLIQYEIAKIEREVHYDDLISTIEVDRRIEALEYALEIIKKQDEKDVQLEPQALGRGFKVYECPTCHHQLDEKLMHPYCYNCGQKVRWNID